MQYETCTANDGCTLAFQTSVPLADVGAKKPRHCILLMHGFSGSSEYFTRNSAPLSEQALVVAPDMRGHGRSGRTRGGYHVARLAADLRTLVSHLQKHLGADSGPALATIVPVGCSIGAAVLWTYIELFGNDPFAGFVFVDQAPLQDRAPRFDGWDETRAHTGCYDEATTLAAQSAWMDDTAGAHAGLVQACLGYRHAPGAADESSDDGKRERRRAEDEAFFTAISAQCDQAWLARLLADHTRYDHREAIELIDRPVLVMAGKRSGCFPLEGMLETVRRAEAGLASASVFDSGHWLFYEEPERFNGEVAEFATRTCPSFITR